MQQRRRPGSQRPNRPASSYMQRRSSMAPPLKAGLIFIIPLLIVQILNALVFSHVRWFLYPLPLLYILQPIIYLLCGYFAAQFFSQRIFRQQGKRMRSEYVKNGAAAGLVLSICTWLIDAFLILLVGFSALAVPWTNGYSIVLCGPLDILLALFLGAAGGALYARS
jgi:hypothetical protein